jgi:hypothetical protein
MTNYLYGDTVKIGHTQDKPDVRANNLTRQTGVLGEFVVEWYAELSNSKIGEQLLHQLFDKFHIDKEYFYIELEEAIKLFEDKLKKFFTEESVIPVRPPKPKLKQKSERERKILEVVDLTRKRNLEAIHQIEINQLRDKLLYNSNEYFKKIYSELSEYFSKNVDTLTNTKDPKYLFDSVCEIYLPMNNNFSKWLGKEFEEQKIFDKTIDFGYDDQFDNLDDCAEEVNIVIMIPCLLGNLSAIGEGFVQVLQNHGISSHFEVFKIPSSEKRIDSVYFEKVFEEIEANFLKSIEPQKIEQLEIIDKKVWGNIYITLDTDFSKWLFDKQDYLKKEIITDFSSSIILGMVEDQQKNNKSFRIEIPFNSQKVNYLFVNAFIKVLESNDITVWYEIIEITKDLFYSDEIDICENGNLSLFIDNKIKKWHFKKPHYNLNLCDVLGEDSITNLEYTEGENHFIAEYYDYDSSDLKAIFNLNGKIIIKGINNLEEYVKELNLFKIEINSNNIDGDLYYYHGLSSDTTYYAIVNYHGDLLITFTEDYIYYDDDEKAFQVGNDEDFIYLK